MSKPRDLSNVVLTPGGLLVATDLGVGVCDHCGDIHVDFYDKDGQMFARATINPADAPEVAAKLIESRDFLVQRDGTKDWRN